MKRVFAVARLTLKAAFRHRLVQVLLVLLCAAVVGLPAVIKHDGSATGFTQILLTYTLGAITVLLGFATLWLACNTLARDIEDCSLQMVVVKPISRWQVWLGKWLGIALLNAGLLAVAGTAVYALMLWRASSLSPEQQERLRGEILVARAAVREEIDFQAIDAEVERLVQERLKDPKVAAMDLNFVRQQARERVNAQFQIVPPGNLRRWVLDFGLRGAAVRDQPLFIRTKFFVAQASRSGTYAGLWEIGPPDGRRYRPEPMSLAAETFHEFRIEPGLLDSQGLLVVDFQNFNETALLFPLDEGMEVLYREGGFGLNFIRGLVIVWCWLALLGTIGLAAGSFLSFPVAAFVSIALLVVSFSTGTLRQVIEEGGVASVNQNTGVIENPGVIDRVAVTVFKQLLGVINLVQGFSPIDSLSTGRSVGWDQIGLALAKIILLLGGLFAAAGILLFTRRELAAVSPHQ